MAEKKFKGSPFGTQTARFDVSAVHPANKRVGTYTEIPYCKRRTSDLERNLGPGSYNTDSGDFSARAVAERARGPGWHRAQETAKLAQMPHLLYQEAWENKHFLKTKVGPGSYRTTDFIQELEKKPRSVRGVCDGREERFREPKSRTPGPGCYGKGGVPWAALEEKRAKSIAGPSMHLSTGLERFPKSIEDCGLSPCTYSLRSNTEVLLGSSVTQRGPYDLFTGPRDKPITAGYFAAPKRVSLVSGEYEAEGLGEAWSRRERKKHGVFSRLDQYPSVVTERIYHSTLAQCPRPATFPGPGWYKMEPLSRPESRCPPPFLSSAPRVTKRMESVYRQSVNYKTGGARKPKATPPRSAPEQRCHGNPGRDKHAQERLRPLNVPVDRRSFLVPLGQSGGNALVTTA